jgi:hypothetical protein
MWIWNNWVAFSYLHPLCGPCARWLYASSTTHNLGFSEFLQELPHFFQFLLQFISVVCYMIKFLCKAILDHSDNHLSIFLCDCVFWWWSLCLWFIARTYFLYHWSLSSTYFLCDEVHRGFLCSLNWVLLFIGWLSGFCSPFLGPWLLWVTLYLSQLDLACSWFLGYSDLWRLCFRLQSPSFYCLS